MIVVGDCVILSVLPEWVEQLPEESQRVFRFCVGRVYSIVEIDSNGLYVLDVSKDIDELYGGYMNDIRVEKDYIAKVECE